MSSWQTILWIVCLAFLSVGARNFELGMSIDGYLYSAIARNIVQTGEWFRLHGGVSEFSTFAEHPHLGFWLVAFVFKFLPAADWSARIVGHLFYVGFLGLIYWAVRRWSGEGSGREGAEKKAVLVVLGLWILPRFSNFFSNVYLDPGALFFGSAAVFGAWRASESKRSWLWFLLAGLLLALCLMQKGLTILGFGLPLLCAWLWLWNRRGAREAIAGAAAFLFGFGILTGAYIYAVLHSHCPEFFQIYWARQVSNRFSKITSVWNLFAPRFWIWLLKDTLGIVLLAVWALVCGLRKSFAERRLAFWIPASLLLGFYFVYAPADRVGNQYFLMFAPWIVWLAVDAFENWIPFDAQSLRRGSQWIAVLGVVVLQYAPVKTHGGGPHESNARVIELKKTKQLQLLILDDGGAGGFGTGASRTWYANIETQDQAREKSPERADWRMAYLFIPESYREQRAARQGEIEKSGWCLDQDFGSESLWLKCAALSLRPLDTRDRSFRREMKTVQCGSASVQLGQGIDREPRHEDNDSFGGAVNFWPAMVMGSGANAREAPLDRDYQGHEWRGSACDEKAGVLYAASEIATEGTGPELAVFRWDGRVFEALAVIPKNTWTDELVRLSVVSGQLRASLKTIDGADYALRFQDGTWHLQTSW